MKRLPKGMRKLCDLREIEIPECKTKELDLRLDRSDDQRVEFRDVLVNLRGTQDEIVVHTWLGNFLRSTKRGVGEQLRVRVWIPGEDPGIGAFGRESVGEARTKQKLSLASRIPQRLEGLDLASVGVFVEEGQGVAQAHGLRTITTSALTGCSFIAGLNEYSGAAGAFHYSALSLHRPGVLASMNQWFDKFKPSQVVLVFSNLRITGVGLQADERALHQWVETRGVIPSETRANNPMMRIWKGQLEAGEFPISMSGGAFSLEHLPSSLYTDHYGRGLQLFGENVDLSSSD
jgi:hypothetical protein